MWVCKRCGSTFSDPDDVMDEYCGDRYAVCPICNSRTIKETRICYACGNATENYGLCDTCRIEVKKDFAAWLMEEVRNRNIRVDDVADCVYQYIEYL